MSLCLSRYCGLVFALGLMLGAASRAGAQPLDRSVTFRFSSAGGMFGLQGTFAGSYIIERDHIELHFDEAEIFASETLRAEARESVSGVDIGLATTIDDKNNWRVLRHAKEIPVGKVFSRGTRLNLGQLDLSIPIDNTMKMPRYWIMVSILGPRRPRDNRVSSTWHVKSNSDIFSQVNIPLAPPPTPPADALSVAPATPTAQLPAAPLVAPPAALPVLLPAPAFLKKNSPIIEPRRLLGMPATVAGAAWGALAFAPGTPLGVRGVLAVAGSDGSITLWNPRSSGIAPENQPDRVLAGLPQPATQLAFSPDGKLLAAAALVREAGGEVVGSRIGVWDITSGTRLALFEGPNRSIKYLQFLPNAQTLAVAGRRSATGAANTGGDTERPLLLLFDIASGQARSQLNADTLALAFDGQFAAVNGSPGAPATRGEESEALASNYSRVSLLDLWANAAPEPASKPEPKAEAQGGHLTSKLGAAFSPDGRTLAMGAQSINLWDTSTEKWRLTIAQVLARDDRMVFSADGSRLAVLASDGASIWDAHSGNLISRIQPVRPPGTSSLPLQGAFSPSGKLLALLLPTSPTEREVLIYDLSSAPALN